MLKYFLLEHVFLLRRKVSIYQKGKSEVLNRGTDNTMANRKRIQRQTVVDTMIHRKLKIEQLKTGVNSCAPEG